MQKVACIGGGVIGGGWAARFALNGWSVALYDPAPDAQRTVAEVLANAERAFPRLVDRPLPPRGPLHVCTSLEEAVADADYVQESVPERLDLKHSVIAEIEAHAPRRALIGSSTSGFTPSALQAGMTAPERLFVAHPFNPVYLLPLVEVVPSAATAADAVEKACTMFRALGMAPLVVRKEIDAHIADRLLEAVWREALWLVHDAVATTEEIDEAIRLGFGLRWAQMGLFETYRIAGGEAGMKHFIGQFGPALAWPWTKLMDVPALTPDLIDKIAAQSDAQSGAHSIRELERIRDDNLVDILRVLKDRDWGAGRALNAYEGALPPRALRPPAEAGWLALHGAEVLPGWVDYNGHMTEHRYLQVFGEATDAFLLHIGMDAAYRAQGRSVYTVESHLRHLSEAHAGMQLAVATRLLGYDEKRVRIVHRLTAAGTEGDLATAEHMLLSVDTKAERACAMASPLPARLAEVAGAQQTLDAPDWAGHAIRTL